MAKRFAGFTPQQKVTLLTKMGYGGYVTDTNVQQFLAQNPAAASSLDKYTQAAQRAIAGNNIPTMKMNNGGLAVTYNSSSDKPFTVRNAQGYTVKSFSSQDAANAYVASQNPTTTANSTAGTTTGATTTGTTGSTNPFSNINPAVANVIQNVNPAFGNVSNAATTGTTTTGGTAEEGLNISARDIGGSLDDWLDFYRRQHGGTTGGGTGGTTTTPAIPVAPTAPSGDPLEYMRTKVLLPDYAEQPLADVVKKGTDVSSGTIGADNTVTFADGTTIKARNLQEAQYIVNAGKKYTTEVVDPFKQLQAQYQQDVQTYAQQTRGQAAATTADLSGSIASLRSDINTSKIERDNYARELSALPENDPRRNTLSTLIGNIDKDIAAKQTTANTLIAQQPTLAEVTAKQVTSPTLPTGATVAPVKTTTTPDQFMAPGAGQVTGQIAIPTAMAGTTSATAGQADAVTIEAEKVAPAVEGVVQQTKAVTGTVTPEAQVTAQTMDSANLAQLGMTAAQIEQAQTVKAPPPLEVQAGELISGPSVDMARVEQLMSNVKAAEATPSEMATVQGQMSQLMTQFEGKEPPAWAAGAMRAATATLAARGLGASSMAGQAIVQAAMESALPIAMQDAQTRASFEAQNLSNRQQVAMFAAEQRAAFLGMEFTQDFQARVQNAARIADVANMNFNADVQIALENSRNAQTVDISNLNARNAKLLADMAAMTQVELTNLNNRQQAAVQNAQAFLQMDMQNLSNEQQITLFNAQSRVQAMLSDAAAENAARQFNASSEMQTNQFNANLATQISQFNASQRNAQEQFNAAQKNTVDRFNAELNNQREQFNAQNQLIIEQSNVQWRRELATAETEAVNRANEINAANTLNISKTAQDNLWQYQRDNMEWAWTSAENERQRVSNLAIATLNADTEKSLAAMKQDAASSSAFGSFVGKLLTSDLTGSVIGGWLS